MKKEIISHDFFDKMSQLFGQDQIEKMKLQFSQPLNHTARIHPRRKDHLYLSQYFNKNQYDFNSDLQFLSVKNEYKRIFTLHPLFFGGYYYFQEYSSMQSVKALNIQKGDIVLDVCAAPGSKSTQILELLDETGFLICNEIDRARVSRLIDNISRWGYSNIMVVSQDSSKFSEMGEIFDKILVDAPCSGEGMFHKLPESMSHWSQNKVNQCSKIQKNILKAMIPALKPQGYLVYSTCTYSPEENEEVVEFILQEYSDCLELIPLNLGGKEGLSFYQGKGFHFDPILVQRFISGESFGEGFFIACFRKKESLNFKKKKLILHRKNHLIEFSHHKVKAEKHKG